MNKSNFIREFYGFDISFEDQVTIENLLSEHDATKVLNYHGYLNPKSTFKTVFANDLKSLGKKLDLRLAGIYAFTGLKGTITSKHIDGDESGPLPWRLCFYRKAKNAVLSWYENDSNNQFNTHVGAYINDSVSAPLYSEVLSMSSAFVRTDIPHVLDMMSCIEDRLTITATFKPYISWEELNRRLDHVENSR